MLNSASLRYLDVLLKATTYSWHNSGDGGGEIMHHHLFIELEHTLRSLLGKVDRGSFGGLINADMLEHGFAFSGLASGLSPMYLEAKRNGNQEMVTQIDDIIEAHIELGEVEKNSERYIELTKSAIEAVKKLK